LKYKKHLTTLAEDVQSGEGSLTIKGSSDLQKGTTIMLGTGGINEVHTIRSIDYKSDDIAEVLLMNEFDLDYIVYTWSADTPVYRVIPASIVELKDAESVFPLYFIYAEVFTNYEDAMSNGYEWGNYVRDAEGNHKVSIRNAWDAVTSNVTINVFSNVPEVALEMWRFLKSKVTTRDILNVAGRNIQYTITGERDVAPEDAETLPNYIMDLTFYFKHNLYNRKYVNYPRFSKMELAYEIKAVEVIT
jgi:hypothetical protein